MRRKWMPFALAAIIAASAAITPVYCRRPALRVAAQQF